MKFRIPKIVISRKKYSEANLVPKKFDDFLSDVNSICSSYITDFFHGREKEIDRIFTCFMLTRNNNVLLIGDPGVGKKSIIQSMVNKVLKGECPDDLKETHFFTLNIEKVIAIISSDDRRAKREVSKLFNYLSTVDDVVLVINQIQLMAYSSDLTYILSELLHMPNIRVLGIATIDDMVDFVSLAPNLLQLVNIIPVLEPELNKMHSMISEYVGVLAKAHGVTVSEEMIDYGISLSYIIPSEQCNPGKTMQAIEKAMVIAKDRNHEHVTREDFNSTLGLDFEFFGKISDEDKEITAYHETGHFLITKISDNIRDLKTTAVTIVPSEIEGFLGVTLHTREAEKQTNHNTDYYIDIIAYYLGGRVAEEILLGEEAKPSSGAASDLKIATSYARTIVTEYGMIDSCSKNMTDFCNYGLDDLALLSESKKRLIETEVQKLIEEGYNRAKTILNQNRSLLDLIAQELLTHKILDEKDLDRLCSQVNNN